MANNQHERRGAVVHDSRGFGLTKDGEGPLEIPTAITAGTAPEIDFYIIIRGGDVAEDFARALGKR